MAAGSCWLLPARSGRRPGEASEEHAAAAEEEGLGTLAGVRESWVGGDGLFLWAACERIDPWGGKKTGRKITNENKTEVGG